jgi:CopG family nickel-responsive transcriptional regulator
MTNCVGIVPPTPWESRDFMNELTRISISLEENLLLAFDDHLASKGYGTRSEAVRDLIRDRLIRDEARKQSGEVVAIVSMVFDHQARELASRLIDKQHNHHDLVIATLHVHLSQRHCLEVSVLRGNAKDVMHLGDELLATKGVLHGEITVTAGEETIKTMQ